VLDNVPADVVRSMGADVVIAVDVGSKPVDRTYIQSFAGMLDQAITVMMVSRTREILSQADIIIAPELKSVKSTDWRKSDAIADLGYESTQTKERFLSTLTLDPDSWKAHLEERRKRARGEPQKIEFIIVEGAAEREQEYIRLKLSGVLGRPLDVPELEKDLTGIVGEGRYESMSYELTMEQGRTGLRVLAKEKSYGPPFGRFLLRVNNTRQGAMDAAFGTRLTFYDAGKLMPSCASTSSPAQNSLQPPSISIPSAVPGSSLCRAPDSTHEPECLCFRHARCRLHHSPGCRPGGFRPPDEPPQPTHSRLRHRLCRREGRIRQPPPAQPERQNDRGSVAVALQPAEQPHDPLVRRVRGLLRPMGDG